MKSVCFVLSIGVVGDHVWYLKHHPFHRELRPWSLGRVGKHVSGGARRPISAGHCQDTRFFTASLGASRGGIEVCRTDTYRTAILIRLTAHVHVLRLPKCVLLRAGRRPASGCWKSLGARSDGKRWDRNVGVADRDVAPAWSSASTSFLLPRPLRLYVIVDVESSHARHTTPPQGHHYIE